MNHERRCRSCLDTMEDGSVSHPVLVGDRLVLLENVPAFVCGQCGDWSIAATVSKKIDHIIYSSDPPARWVQVAVYDLAEETSFAPPTREVSND